MINAVDLAFVNRNLNARVCSAPPPAAPTIVATDAGGERQRLAQHQLDDRVHLHERDDLPRPGDGEYGGRESGD